MIVKVNFQCPVCENVISAPEGMRGQLWKCPHCKYSVKIPEQSPNPPNCESNITIPEQSPNPPNREYSITIPEQSSNSLTIKQMTYHNDSSFFSRDKNIETVNNGFDSSIRKVSNFGRQVLCNKKKAIVVGIITFFAGCIILGLLLNHYKDGISISKNSPPEGTVYRLAAKCLADEKNVHNYTYFQGRKIQNSFSRIQGGEKIFFYDVVLRDGWGKGDFPYSVRIGIVLRGDYWEVVSFSE